MRVTYWKPDPIWEGQDAYIIGGGPSLRQFNWDLLRGRNTIGCNSAYTLGRDICKVLFFGDRKFYETWRSELKSFGNMIVTNCTSIAQIYQSISWLHVMDRVPRGLGVGEKLGWCFSSGAASINLALSFGAKRVFLLGIDLGQTPEGRHNWHDRQENRINKDVYERFREGYRYVARDLPKFFPGREVICLADEVRLDVFPVQSLSQHFGGDA